MSEDISNQVSPETVIMDTRLSNGFIYNSQQMIKNYTELSPINIGNIIKIKACANRIIENSSSIIRDMEALELMYVNGELE